MNCLRTALQEHTRHFFVSNPSHPNLNWSWNSSTLATWCEKLTHWKRSWCWERSKAGGEGDDRVWDGWMASLTQWTWVWASSGSWWWTGRPGMLRFMGSLRVGHDWAIELNWTEKSAYVFYNHKLAILNNVSDIKETLLPPRPPF